MARVLYSGVDEYGQPSEVMLGCAIGDIIPHFGTTPPPGTLYCDGSEVSREAYAELYQEIGALCGPGDGSTTFNLPDLRGKWMMGADAVRATGTSVAEGLPNIIGSMLQRPAAEGTYPNYMYYPILLSAVGVLQGGNDLLQNTWNFGLAKGALSSNSAKDIQTYNITFDASRASAIYGASAHVTPESVAVLPCIVYE